MKFQSKLLFFLIFWSQDCVDVFNVFQHLKTFIVFSVFSNASVLNTQRKYLLNFLFLFTFEFGVYDFPRKASSLYLSLIIKILIRSGAERRTKQQNFETRCTRETRWRVKIQPQWNSTKGINGNFRVSCRKSTDNWRRRFN